MRGNVGGYGANTVPTTSHCHDNPVRAHHNNSLMPVHHAANTGPATSHRYNSRYLLTMTLMTPLLSHTAVTIRCLFATKKAKCPSTTRTALYTLTASATTITS